MTVARSVADVLDDHVMFKVESSAQAALIVVISLL
jgi:hypothetical protein